MQLVIAEKPSVAKSIADVLGARDKKDGYFEGGEYFVSWCVGHLIELSTPEKYNESWKKWTYETLPMIPDIWKTEVKADVAKQYKVLKDLIRSEKVTSICCATDAGREGELIFRLVVDQIGVDKPMKRLWISSMEESAIREGFRNLRTSSDYENLYHSALARQRADWLVGLNGTRLFTSIYGGKLLKVGRVQTPTLAMLVDRETEIDNFVKEKYFVVHCGKDGLDAVSEHIKELAQAEELIRKIAGMDAVIEDVSEEQKSIAPPRLYDLTSLQRDANKIFSMTAKQTLEYAQSLYEKKLLTYPRTDSQYLSDDMEQTAKNVIAVITENAPFIENAMIDPDVKRVMNSKKVTDHHAIIPTIEVKMSTLESLPEPEKKILFLVASRLLCATAPKYEYLSKKITVKVGDTYFTTSGKTVVNNGWKDFEEAFRKYYKVDSSKDNEQEENMDADDNLSQGSLPDLKKGDVLYGSTYKYTEHFTKPPKHYSEDTLLAAMERAGAEDMGDEVERKGLGTPATRADIIEKLVKDGYVKREKKQMLPTDDGIKLITILPDVVKSPKLTADWENALTLVSKGTIPMDEFMNGIEDMVKELVKTYHAVGDEEKMFSNANSLGTCPKCGADIVKGKYGAYCKGKCGMNIGKAMGATLSDSQIKSLLAGKKILVKGLKGKNGTYDAYLSPEGLEDFFYTKDGKEVTGTQYKFSMNFPKK